MTRSPLLWTLLAVLLLGAVGWVVLGPSAAELALDGDEPGTRAEQEAAGASSDESPEDPLESRAEIATEDADSTGDATTLTRSRPVEMGVPSFTGRLLRPDGRPAAQASVQAWGFFGRVRGYDPADTRRRPAAERQVQTDGRGRFAIPESPNESLRWILRLEAEGFPSMDVIDLGSLPGRTRELGDLQLSESSVLRGVVVSEAGAPVVAADVELHVATHGPRLSRWLETDLFPVPDARTTTAADGSFELRDVPTGSLRLAAHSPGFVRDFSAAVELEAGSARDRIEIVLTPARPLAGTVRSVDGAALPGIQVEARWRPIGEATVTTDAAGQFSLDLPEEASEIVVRASGLGWAVLRRKVANKERDQALDLNLARVGLLQGIVLDEQEQPLADAEVALFEQSKIRLARVAPWQLDALAWSRTDADGRFQLEADPGATADSRFRVVAWTPRHQPGTSRSLQFAQRGDQAPAALSEELRLVLEDGFQITGTVSTADGQPAAGARVHLRRDGSAAGGNDLSAGLAAASGDLVAAVTASERGTFVMNGVAGGDYHLEAMLPGHSPARGVNFSLVDRSWEEDLRLLHGCGIRGEVRGDRAALPRLQVIAVSEDGRAHPTLVQPDGFFELPDLPPGAYEVDLFQDVGGSVASFGRRQGPRLAEQLEVQVLEGQWTDVVFPLSFTELGAVAGNVLVDGRPAPDYRVFLVPAGHEGSEAERERQYVLDNMRSTHTDRDGQYRFVGLPELEYWIVLAPPSAAAIGAIGGVTADDGPVGLARARVAPEGGEEARHDFQLQTARLAGRLLRGRGERAKPVRDGLATLIPVDADAGLRRFRITLDRDGRYEFPPLPAGMWRLDLRSGEDRVRTEAFTLAPGETVEREDRIR